METIRHESSRVRGLKVSIEAISRNYGNFSAVDRISLDIAAGEFVSLLGPSGSGKTTLLMLLAGFDDPSSGRIVVGDQDLTRVPANKRNIGMVFQKYALFPHMSVADNIAFPLRMRGVAKPEREERIRHALDMVRLQGYEARMPGQLSGGQQQRVALARAIVFNPPVILMDEPLGALDKKLRQHLQLEIKQLQERLGATVIFVTHDQEEALTMSDRIVVLNHGKVMQVGPPRELYERPASPFVADFLGEMNFLRGEVLETEHGRCRVAIGHAAVAALVRGGAALTAGMRARVAIRPERLNVLMQGKPATVSDELGGRVSQLVFNGASLAIFIQLNGGEIVRSDVSARSELAGLKVGDPVTVSWTAEDAHVYAETA